MSAKWEAMEWKYWGKFPTLLLTLFQGGFVESQAVAPDR